MKKMLNNVKKWQKRAKKRPQNGQIKKKSNRFSGLKLPQKIDTVG